MFCIKIHRSENRNITAVCDEEILGKEFSSNGLKIKVSDNFFNGEKKNAEEIENLLTNFSDFNLVGEKIINLALNLGMITKDQVLIVENVPYTMIFQI